MHSLEHQYVLRAYGTSEGLNSSDKERSDTCPPWTPHTQLRPQSKDSAPLVVLSPSWREYMYVESGTDRLLEFPICTFHA